MTRASTSGAGASVCVVGLGPAGRALAHRLVRHGVGVTAVDAAPERRWTPTYAAWADELPGWLEPGVVASRFSPWVRGERRRRLEREYVVLGTAALQQSLPLDGVETVTGLAREVGPHRVVLADGRRLGADLVVDARGAGLHPRRAQQTASGVVVERSEAERRLEGCWLMDWASDHGAGPAAPPSFLYAVALDADRVLLEETCLVGRPPLGLRELRSRLEHRLAARGFSLSGFEPVEHVRFATEPDPRERGRRPLAFGARGGLMHPATGYSVATSLRLAEELAGAVAGGRDPWRTLWSPGALATARLRQAGLRTLLDLDAAGTRAFFDAFFALETSLQRGYLSERDAPATTLAAMAAMSRRLRPALVATAVRATAAELAPPVPRLVTPALLRRRRPPAPRPRV